MPATYEVGDGKPSGTIQAGIDLVPGNLAGQGHQWVKVYAKAAGYAEALDLSTGFSNGSAADYIVCQAMVSHGGLRGQGIVVDIGSAATGTGILIGSAYTRLMGFCLTRSSFLVGGQNQAIQINTNNTIVDSNIIYTLRGSNGTSLFGYYVYPDVAYIANWFINNQLMDIGTIDGNDGWGSGTYVNADGTAGNEQVLAHNVCINCSAQGIRCAAGKDYILVYNNYASVPYNDFEGFTGAHNVLGYNISADTSSNTWGGVGNLINKAAADQFVSVVPGYEDLHPKMLS